MYMWNLSQHTISHVINSRITLWFSDNSHLKCETSHILNVFYLNKKKKWKWRWSMPSKMTLRNLWTDAPLNRITSFVCAFQNRWSQCWRVTWFYDVTRSRFSYGHAQTLLGYIWRKIVVKMTTLLKFVELFLHSYNDKVRDLGLGLSCSCLNKNFDI